MSVPARHPSAVFLHATFRTPSIRPKAFREKPETSAFRETQQHQYLVGTLFAKPDSSLTKTAGINGLNPSRAGRLAQFLRQSLVDRTPNCFFVRSFGRPVTVHCHPFWRVVNRLAGMGVMHRRQAIVVGQHELTTGILAPWRSEFFVHFSILSYFARNLGAKLRTTYLRTRYSQNRQDELP